MHLIVPFAGTASEAGLQALQTLSLPHLDRMLARLTPGAPFGSDEFSLNPPHEQALALALGWTNNAATLPGRALPDCALPDCALPFAAQQAQALGLPGATTAAWGCLTPVHLHAGSEQISLTDPAALQLDEAASRAALDAVQHLFTSEGVHLHWAAPLVWLASHPQFDGMATASLDRVMGRQLTPWLPDRQSARLIRRLQNEVQMLLYTHPLNDRREAAGLPTINSFWLSGCGTLPTSNTPPEALQIDHRLRAPALAEDWAAWCEAWRALDNGPIAGLLQQPGSARLTLCGERFAQPFTLQPQPWWQALLQRWRQPATTSVLEAL